ncbi:RAB3A, member RAS oncogene family, a isoform X2 [Platichthys flesus]|uniref:RAB3A, member RAS oncogene family, a isoform X2 n=1 Tax=Platichthys flesus TaxID=8260 RepID=UPI002DB6DFC5|nr:RAB3A, member RAS oncogene family, a isoform X2 [Platichthys flesus]
MYEKNQNEHCKWTQYSCAWLPACFPRTWWRCGRAVHLLPLPWSCPWSLRPVDTAGQERYRTITTAYYRGAMGFILMYDITNEESFNAVQDWSTQIKTYSWDNAQVLLVGNKCDMDDERVVAAERGQQLSEQLGFEYFEVSAKDNVNVKQTFERLVDIICERMSESLDNNDPSVTGNKQGPQLSEQPQRSSQDCAC